MFLATNAICETRYTREAKLIKITKIIEKGLQTTLLAILMSILAACSGIPFVPGI